MSQISNRPERNFPKILTFILTLTLFLCSGGGGACADTPLKAFPKYVYSQKIEVPHPNVLFLLDIGAQMAFETHGVLPLATDSNGITVRQEMMENCTYGVGVGPIQIVDGFSASIAKGIYDKHYITIDEQYGRDMDSTNNKEVVVENLLPYCYYASADTYPYQNGLSTRPSELIPNDSRMYKMKLALWRLLYPDTDPLTASTAEEWKRKLSFMNFGMATTYIENYIYSYASKTMSIAATTLSPNITVHIGLYPIGEGEDGYFTFSPITRKYPFGSDNAGLSWLGLGNEDATDSIRAGIKGIDLSLYDNYQAGSLDWLRMNRARLEVPFGKLYFLQSGTVIPTQNLDIISRLINSTLNIKQRSAFRINANYENFAFINYLVSGEHDEELFPSGRTNLATSLYARDYYDGKVLGEVIGGGLGGINYGIITYNPAYICSDTNGIWPSPNGTTYRKTIYEEVASPYHRRTLEEFTYTYPTLSKKGFFSIYPFNDFVYNTPPFEYSDYGPNSVVYDHEDLLRIKYSYTPGFLNYLFEGKFTQYDFYVNNSVIRHNIGVEDHVSNRATGSVLDFFSPYPRIDSIQHGGLDFMEIRRQPVDNISFLFTFYTTVGNFPILGSCQRNYVVTFTAGDNELTGNFTSNEMGLSGHIRTAPEAALELYKKSTGPQTEYPIRGTDIFDINEDNVLQLREGQYDMEKGIRTFVVGMVEADSPKVAALRTQLEAVAASGQPKLVNNQWVPDPDKKPIFISKTPSVAEGMRDFIQEIREKIINRIYQDYIDDTKEDNSYLYRTSTAPLIRLDESKTSGQIFRATFQKNKTDQWHSDFKCLNLSVTSSDITETNSPWYNTSDSSQHYYGDAGYLISSNPTRNLFTSRGLSGTNDTSPVNLRTADFQTLSDAMGLSGVESATLLKFKNWLLNPASDGHSDPTAPTDVTPLGDIQGNFLYVERGSDEDDTIYFQTNRGMLHELNASTGQENWVFIPPNIFQDRLKSLKFDENNNYYDSNPTNGRRSLALNLLDGKISSVVLNDRRVLIGTLGRGGNGLYAMDITNPSTEPTFLWSIENPRYDTASSVIKWGNTAPTADYNYNQLGLTTAGVTLTQLKSQDDITSITTTIGILPGGIAYDLTTGNDQGKVIYIINPLNGAILAALNTLTTGTLGMIIASPTLIPSASNSKSLGSFFVGDSNGNILYGEPTDATGLHWEALRPIAHLQNGADPIPLTRSLLAIKDSNSSKLYLLGGSNNISGPNLYENGNNLIKSDQHFIFSLVSSKNPPATTTSMTDLTDLLDLSKISDITTTAPNVGSKGWYVKLRIKDDDYYAEEISVSPTLYGSDACAIATFSPTNTDINEKLAGLACPLPPSGIARLYFFDPKSGHARQNCVELPDLKVTAITSIGERLLISVQKFTEGAVEAASDSTDPTHDSRISKLNSTTLIFTPLATEGQQEEPEPVSAIAPTGTAYNEFYRTLDYANAAD